MKDMKSKVLWSLVLLALIGLTIYAIVGTNESFTIDGFISYIKSASPGWIFGAFVCMWHLRFCVEHLVTKDLLENVWYIHHLTFISQQLLHQQQVDSRHQHIL
jgi:hypothetical protein